MRAWARLLMHAHFHEGVIVAAVVSSVKKKRPSRAILKQQPHTGDRRLTRHLIHSDENQVVRESSANKARSLAVLPLLQSRQKMAKAEEYHTSGRGLVFP